MSAIVFDGGKARMPEPALHTSTTAVEAPKQIVDGAVNSESVQWEKPVIIINGRDTADVTDEAWDELRAANRQTDLFVRNGELVVVSRDEEYRAFIEPVTKDLLDDRLHRIARFIRVNKDGTEVEQASSHSVVHKIASCSPLERRFSSSVPDMALAA